MVNVDIWINIIYHTEDIKTLINISSVDSVVRKICSQKYFWSIYYKKSNLILPLKNYTNTAKWIKSFINSRKTKEILDYIDGDCIKYVTIDISDVDKCKYLTGDINNDKKIKQFIGNLEPYTKFKNRYVIHMSKKDDIFWLYYQFIAVINFGFNEAADQLKIKSNDIEKLLYILFYNNAKLITGSY